MQGGQPGGPSQCYGGGVVKDISGTTEHVRLLRPCGKDMSECDQLLQSR